MDQDVESATVHIFRSTGEGRPVNADAVAVFRRPMTGVLAVSLVDGIGRGEHVADLMQDLARAATRVGARDGAREGLLTAAHIAADPLDPKTPDGVMVLAVVPPGDPATLAYVGDCSAYGMSEDGELQQLTVAHSHGEELRQHGFPEPIGAKHDYQVLTTLARATVPTVSVVRNVRHQRFYLMSDGVWKAVPHDQLAAIAREHQDDPQACAEAFVSVARAAGSEDDSSVAVITRPCPIPIPLR